MEDDQGYQHEATPVVSDLEIESAILKGVASHRPVGRHKHILIISLQTQVHEQTGVWVPITRLWDTLGDLYNLDALDQQSSSTPSLPSSPDQLSPIPLRQRRPKRSASLSSLSSSPPSPPGASSDSKSAKVINSAHFNRDFELPPLRHASEEGPDSDDLEWHELLYSRAAGQDENESEWKDSIDRQLRENRTPSPEEKPSKKGPAKRRRGQRDSTGTEDGEGQRGQGPAKRGRGGRRRQT